MISGDLWGSWYTDDDHFIHRTHNITRKDLDPKNPNDPLFDKDDVEKAKKEAEEAEDVIKEDPDSAHVDENGYIWTKVDNTC